MLHEILHEKQEQRIPLISVLTTATLYTTPYLKTHVAGEYTNTHTASALMLR